MQVKFNNLSRYSLDNSLFLKHLNKDLDKIEYTVKKKPKEIKKIRYIVPKEKDKLFWCFYILYKGIDEYNNINSHFAVEKTFKLDFVNIIRENKALLKFYKLKRSDVENQLVNEYKIERNVFCLLCIYYEIDIMFILKNFYYEINGLSKNDKINIISCINGDYCIDSEIGHIDFYRLNYYRMDNLNRIIKPLSGYKLDELQNICIKLNINLENSTSKQKTKTELYTDIVSLIES